MNEDPEAAALLADPVPTIKLPDGEPLRIPWLDSLDSDEPTRH